MNEHTRARRGRGINRWRLMGWSVIAGLLIMPAVAMQFSDEVKWGPEDFIFAAVLLGGCGLLLELGVRVSANASYRAGVALTALALLLLAWINGAVGIIGNEGNPANLLYVGVFLAVALGAVLARFRAPGMARAVLAAAIVQAAIMVAAPLAWWGPPGEAALRTFCLNGIFVVIWLVAWALFCRAAGETGSTVESIARGD